MKYVIVGTVCLLVGYLIGSATWQKEAESGLRVMKMQTETIDRLKFPHSPEYTGFLDTVYAGAKINFSGKAVPVDGKTYKSTGEEAVRFQVDQIGPIDQVRGTEVLTWKGKAYPWRENRPPMMPGPGTWREGSGEYSDVPEEERGKKPRTILMILYDSDGAYWLNERYSEDILSQKLYRLYPQQ